MFFFLIIRGPAGVGKTTIAKKLAHKLGGVCISIDEKLRKYGLDKVDKKEGCIPKKNFIKAQELSFSKASKALKSGKPVIFEGNFYYKKQIEHLKINLEYPPVVFTLQCSFNTCWKRNLIRKEFQMNKISVQAVYKLSTRNNFGTIINTDHLSKLEVLNKILFEALHKQAKQDLNIIGFFMTGSRGKGFHSEHSDYDLYFIVKDSIADKYKEKFCRKNYTGFDLSVAGLTEFKRMSAFGSDTEWDRYDFTHVKALIDKTRTIQKIIDEKGSLPTDRKDEYIRKHLDGYLNGFYRSVKAHQKKNQIGILLEAAQALPIGILFALDGRLGPFPDYLGKELLRYPLKKFPWTSKKILDALLKIVTTGDLKIQQDLAKVIEKVFRKAGYGKIFDDWGEKLHWAIKFNT